MNFSLKIYPKNPNHLNEYPLYVRIRGKDKRGKWKESEIFTDLYVKKSHIKNGVLTRKDSSYKFKQDVVSTIFTDLEITLSVLKKEGLEPTPSLLKNSYLDRIDTKKMNTPEVQTFWGSFEKFIDTKKT